MRVDERAFRGRALAEPLRAELLGCEPERERLPGHTDDGITAFTVEAEPRDMEHVRARQAERLIGVSRARVVAVHL